MKKNEDQLEQRFPMRREIKRGYQKSEGYISMVISGQGNKTQNTDDAFPGKNQTNKVIGTENFQDYNNENNEDENVARNND